MGDTQLQLFIYDCPQDQAWAAWQVIDRHELDQDWDGPAPRAGELVVGMAYTHRSTSGDASHTLADELAQAAPGISFLVWTDPAADWQGCLARYTLGLGMFKADCTGEGQAVFGGSEILGVVRAAGTDMERIRRWVGLPWEEVQNHSAEERVIRFEVPGGEA